MGFGASSSYSYKPVAEVKTKGGGEFKDALAKTPGPSGTKKASR